MQARVKVFTYISGTGATVIESRLEDDINGWLAQSGGRIVDISQSESQRPSGGHHVTVCVWYEPEPPVV
jgi:hypothetical protein